MKAMTAVGVLTVAWAVAGCGGSDEPEEKREPMKVEDTVFGPLVTMPGKVQDRTDAAVETRRENLDRRLEEDEGAAGDAPPGD